MSSHSERALLTGFEGNLTEAQARALDELKVELSQSPYADDVEREPETDRFLLRFLRATMRDKAGERMFDVSAAKLRLIRTFEWRREFDVDEIRDKIELGNTFEARPEHYHLFEQVYPSMDIVNHETGQLVRFMRFGRFMACVNPSIITPREWIRCFAYDSILLQRTLRNLSASLGREISTYSTVVDVSGINLVEVVSKIKFIQLMSNMAAENFPETLGQTLVIRTPWIFPTIFNMVKPFIDRDTVSKVVVSSGIPADLLKALVPAETLPKEYGGQANVLLRYPLNDPLDTTK